MLLHCSGFLKDPAEILAEMQEVAGAAGSLSGVSLERAKAVQSSIRTPVDFDAETAWERVGALMSNMEASA